MPGETPVCRDGTGSHVPKVAPGVSAAVTAGRGDVSERGGERREPRFHPPKTRHVESDPKRIFPLLLGFKSEI